MYEQHLSQLCEELHIDPHLATTKGGNPILDLGNGLQIEIQKLDPGARFFSPIRSCPEIKREDLFINLMKANLFGQGTLDGTIAYDDQENLLTLSSHMPYDVKYRPFREAVEDFANIVMYWRDEVDRHVELAEGGIL